MTLSLRPSRRSTSLGCEALEGRNLLAALGADLLSPAPLVTGHAPVESDRVSRAIEAVDQRLLTSPAEATSQAPISVDLNQDGVADTISLWQPQGTAQQVIRVVYGAAPGGPEE